MASDREVRAVRLEKLALIKKKGINPYPAHSNTTETLLVAFNNFETYESKKTQVTLAGRVMSLRPQGALVFLHLYDGTARFQILLKKGDIADADFDFFNQVVDIGDFIECTGTLFLTKRNEKTLLATGWRMLSKSLLPLPEKWHGLKDPDEKFRKRYLDILFNEDVRELIVKKSIFWNSMRSFLLAEGFMEVETPVLENTAGGADAKPFTTHHNALDLDVYLRISAGELWQKRLMVAGFPKVFEIGRIFRNEGMSAEHAQDYTQMEFYSAYTDYTQGMELVKKMYRHVAQETFGTLTFTIGDFTVDLEKEWELFDYTKTIKKYTGIDISTADLAEIEEKLEELKVEYDKKGWNKIRAIDSLWKYCRKQIGGPGFLVGVPKEMSPLAKSSQENPEQVEQFQPLIAGSELGKGYSELNDPIDQAERFSEQSKLRDAGDDEAQMYDHEFVEALEYGMPPTCGFGVSERLFSFLANKPIRETQLFPLMRSRKDTDKESTEE